MPGTGPERVCGALAGKNRAIISADIDAERKRVGRDQKTGKSAMSFMASTCTKTSTSRSRRVVRSEPAAVRLAFFGA